jgi:hypothetical protein
VATLDRLRHGAYTLTLDGKSFRVPKSFPESIKPEPGIESKNKLVKGGEKR